MLCKENRTCFTDTEWHSTLWDIHSPLQDIVSWHMESSSNTEISLVSHSSLTFLLTQLARTTLSLWSQLPSRSFLTQGGFIGVVEQRGAISENKSTKWSTKKTLQMSAGFHFFLWFLNLLEQITIRHCRARQEKSLVPDAQATGFTPDLCNLIKPLRD